MSEAKGGLHGSSSSSSSSTSSNNNQSQQSSDPQRRRINELRGYLIELLQGVWTDCPPSNAPSYFPKEIADIHSETIHDFAAQALMSATQLTLEEFDSISKEHSVAERLSVLDKLIVDTGKVKSDYHPQEPIDIAQAIILRLSEERIKALEATLEAKKQLLHAAEAETSEVTKQAEAIKAKLTQIGDENTQLLRDATNASAGIDLS